jgi:hypothetical protein
MSQYISQKSGKSIRAWGTNEPSSTLSINTNVTIQHWDFPGDSIPVQLMERGYRVINSEQQFLYLDGKTSDNGQFPVELNQDLMWSGAPDGGGWAPNIFTGHDSSNNTNPENPLLRGAIMAIWNDWGTNLVFPRFYRFLNFFQATTLPHRSRFTTSLLAVLLFSLRKSGRALEFAIPRLLGISSILYTRP